MNFLEPDDRKRLRCILDASEAAPTKLLLVQEAAINYTIPPRKILSFLPLRPRTNVQASISNAIKVAAKSHPCLFDRGVGLFLYSCAFA